MFPLFASFTYAHQRIFVFGPLTLRQRLGKAHCSPAPIASPLWRNGSGVCLAFRAGSQTARPWAASLFSIAGYPTRGVLRLLRSDIMQSRPRGSPSVHFPAAEERTFSVRERFPTRHFPLLFLSIVCVFMYGVFI